MLTLVLAAATISKSVDKAMDKAAKNSKYAPVGVSIRNGPVEDKMDIDGPATNGKRKVRTSNVLKSYKDDSSDDSDAKPLVRVSQ